MAAVRLARLAMHSVAAPQSAACMQCRAKPVAKGKFAAYTTPLSAIKPAWGARLLDVLIDPADKGLLLRFLVTLARANQRCMQYHFKCLRALRVTSSMMVLSDW